MLRSYSDIIDRIPEPPKWWDEQGVPRWCEPVPDELGVYDDVVVFGVIACQYCGREFTVANTSDLTGRMKADWFNVGLAVRVGKPYSEEIDRAQLNTKEVADGFGYGDPPIHGCAGDTMSSDTIKVLEVWERPSPGEWRRRPDIEAELQPETEEE